MYELAEESQKLEIEIQKVKLSIVESCENNIDEAFKMQNSTMVAAIAEILKSV